ncbi:D-tyrosyl-tRNA(Tyr) deacylase [bacterium]|nr:D-tyrosyl-tRNA(Tyr) deacylase [bacterium]MBU1152448.1 D-tyrosyl-tRNA(Tyr) deacylase [bacterium]
MKALIQRVREATILVEEKFVSKINRGLVVFLGVSMDDSSKEVDYLVNKIINLRIFEDEEGRFNYSVLEEKGEILVVSQFTLYADCRKGRRPDFTKAAPKEKAEKLYLEFIDKIKKEGLKVSTGIFQAKMLVDIHNDGPVTIAIES